MEQSWDGENMDDLNKRVEVVEHLTSQLRQVEQRTVALMQENATLQSQIAEQETVEARLRNANRDLEMQRQAQVEENKRTQTLEREQRALTEALRDTIATMSSTLDLNKVLDQILDNIGQAVTPYDGA